MSKQTTAEASSFGSHHSTQTHTQIHTSTHTRMHTHGMQLRATHVNKAGEELERRRLKPEVAPRRI